MKKHSQIFILLITILCLNASACAQKKLTEVEKQFIGTWKKDWQKSLDNLKTIPEADSLVAGISMIVALEKNDIYTLEDDRTFKFKMSSPSLSDVGSQGTGTWNVDKDSNFFLNFKEGTTKGLFKTERLKPYQLHYKVITINDRLISLKLLGGIEGTPPPFLEYLTKQK